MTPLDVAELRRRAEESQSFLSSDKEWTVRVPQRELLALLDLAKRLEATGERLIGAVEACAVADRGGPPVNWDAVDASQDAMRDAVAAAKEAKL